MFKVILNWDGFETTAQFYNYEYALRDLNISVEISEKFRANGLIKKYSVELKKKKRSVAYKGVLNMPLYIIGFILLGVVIDAFYL